jgi:hypothetical protein
VQIKPLILNERIENGIEGKAIFSSDCHYRYVLTRCWDDSAWLNIIMLNPSNGDERILETTTKGVMKRAQKWGYGGMMVANLFNLISTDPKALAKCDDPVGASGDWAIQYMLQWARRDDEPIVCAWGNHGSLLGRDKQVLKLLEGHELQVLALNGNGMPRHPLHMAHNIEPKSWNP